MSYLLDAVAFKNRDSCIFEGVFSEETIKAKFMESSLINMDIVDIPFIFFSRATQTNLRPKL